MQTAKGVISKMIYLTELPSPTRRGELRRGRMSQRFTAVALVSVAIVLAACGRVAPSGDGSSPSKAIAWTSAKGAAFSPQAAARACTASDLNTSVLGNGAWSGKVTEDVTLVNGGHDPCFLPGPPKLAVRSAANASATIDSGSFRTSRVDLMPGQQVEMLFGCASQRGLTDASLDLSPSGGGTKTVGIRLPSDCTSTVLAFQQGPTPAPAGMSALSVGLGLPGTIARGQSLNYTVTLTNNGADAVAVNPCPSYSQHLTQPVGSTVLGVTDTYVLNCSVSNQIPSFGTLSFQMVMQVPSNFRPGPAKFLWDLEVDGRPSAGETVQIN